MDYRLTDRKTMTSWCRARYVAYTRLIDVFRREHECLFSELRPALSSLMERKTKKRTMLLFYSLQTALYKVGLIPILLSHIRIIYRQNLVVINLSYVDFSREYSF